VCVLYALNNWDGPRELTRLCAQAAPTIADAFDACVSDGATTVVVSPYFLSPGRHWQEDLPQLTAAAAAKHPGVRYFVSAPLGLHPLVIQVLDNRLETCLAHATRGGPACDVCSQTGVSCKT
jgi:sirohydrochlorin ferrochelatase